MLVQHPAPKTAQVMAVLDLPLQHLGPEAVWNVGYGCLGSSWVWHRTESMERAEVTGGRCTGLRAVLGKGACKQTIWKVCGDMDMWAVPWLPLVGWELSPQDRRVCTEAPHRLCHFYHHKEHQGHFQFLVCPKAGAAPRTEESMGLLQGWTLEGPCWPQAAGVR